MMYLHHLWDPTAENEWLTDTDQISVSCHHDSSVSERITPVYGPAPPPNFNNDETQLNYSTEYLQSPGIMIQIQKNI